MSPKFSLNHYH